jgi:hypothetical protein
LLIAGCAIQGIQPMPTDIEKSRVFDAEYDSVWNAIIAGVAESNLSITTLEKESAIVAISNAAYDPSWALEGTRGSVLGAQDQVVDRSANFNVLATRLAPNKTRVQVNSIFRMNIRYGNGSAAYPFTYQWEQAYSNGTLERIILDGIANRIRK